MSRVQLFNGEFVHKDQPIILTSNRGFCYGDGFFESIRVSNGKPLFVPAHWNRVLQTAKFLSIDIPAEMNVRKFENFVKELCTQNGLTNARIRFQVFRKGEGKYTPNENGFGWSMICAALPSAEYQLNKKGLLVGICPTHCINPKPQSSFKTSNSLPYILGSQYAQKMNWDDCLMLDSEDFIAESTHSNIFLVKGNTLVTPGLSNGGVMGVMRSVVMQMAAKNGFEVKTVLISEADLLESDEVFLTNAIRGIQWVGAFKRKRFFKKKAEVLLQLLEGSR
ncbi:MAG: aminotransferase class IV family protein [Flavobacteriales bacterium]|nr:aminotransferase class IV family protein [Flavobacteriales bacterium]